MSFQSIADFENLGEEKKSQKHNEISFLSVNYNSGGYLCARLLFLLGNPHRLVIEYDTVTNALRFKPSHDLGAVKLKKSSFPLPERVRHAMGKVPSDGKATVRYNVEQRTDGWWYTSPLKKDEVPR